jgi:hypothetical protein
MIDAWRAGQMTLADLAWQFQARNWPAMLSACPPDLQEARAAVDDLEPCVLGSFDDVVLAYDLGQVTDAEYETLASAAAA